LASGIGKASIYNVNQWLMGKPNRRWNAVFVNVGDQGAKFGSPFSFSNTYYAFLSKADYDESTDTWSVMFEVQPKEWAYNVFNNGSQDVSFLAPGGPASIFHLPYVLTQSLLAVLGLSDTDDVAEGSWYLVQLIKQDQGIVNGIFYNPDIDIHPDDPAMTYGNYEMTAASLQLIPDADLFLPNVQMILRIVDTSIKTLKVKKGIQKRYFPYGRKKRYTRVKKAVQRQLVVAPPVTSIGAMDIGQGNCNLLIDNANEPFTYFDVGYPLNLYLGSLPNNMRFGNVAYQGPITQNTAGDLEVVISHWDWDHWRLGFVAGLQNLDWLVPNQAIGGVTRRFYNSLTNATVYGGAPFNGAGGTYTVYRCVPPPGAARAMLMNNSGLAMLVNMQLPTNSAVATTVMMTGDANFNNIAAGPFLTLSGIEAVHHGSNAHGAAANLPPQIANYNNAGRIFYSCGIRPTGGGLVYVYGFPVPAAIAAYQLAGWGVQRSTAEGALMRAVPTTQANRGNIRVGNQAALPIAYANTAFYNFPNSVN
jgi:hypothetical protein